MKKNNTQVLIIGDANVDMLIHLPAHSAEGKQDIRNPAPRLHGGGTAANVAVGLARLGLPVSFVGSIGADSYGRWIQDDLQKEGIYLVGLNLIEDAFTVMVMAVIEPKGERLIYVWPPTGGAHLQLDKKDINLGEFPEASWLHTSGICLRGDPARNTILNSMEQARDLGWKISIDLNLRTESWGLENDFRQSIEQAIELSDVVFGNAAEEIIPLSGQNTIEESLKQLCDNKRTIVARRGDQGAMICTPGSLFHSPAFPVTIIDTLGAGDAFDAGFIAAQLMGSNTADAARWGNAVAAHKIEHAGARGLPNMEKLRARLNLK